MVIAAHALGLGACWMGSYNSFYEERVKEILNIPENKRLLSIISIGARYKVVVGFELL